MSLIRKISVRGTHLLSHLEVFLSTQACTLLLHFGRYECHSKCQTIVLGGTWQSEFAFLQAGKAYKFM